MPHSQPFTARRLSQALYKFACVHSFAQSPKEITNSIGMKLVLTPKGTFSMGSPIEEEGARPEEEQHQVTISKEFYLGVYEVTQGQYEKVMETNPSHFQKRVIRKNDSSMYPVEDVSWNDAVEFCKRLSELPEEKAAGRVYRLPMEAEPDNPRERRRMPVTGDTVEHWRSGLPEAPQDRAGGLVCGLVGNVAFTARA